MENNVNFHNEKKHRSSNDKKFNRQNLNSTIISVDYLLPEFFTSAKKIWNDFTIHILITSRSYRHTFQKISISQRWTWISQKGKISRQMPQYRNRWKYKVNDIINTIDTRWLREIIQQILQNGGKEVLEWETSIWHWNQVILNLKIWK